MRFVLPGRRRSAPAESVDPSMSVKRKVTVPLGVIAPEARLDLHEDGHRVALGLEDGFAHVAEVLSVRLERQRNVAVTSMRSRSCLEHAPLRPARAEPERAEQATPTSGVMRTGAAKSRPSSNRGAEAERQRAGVREHVVRRRQRGAAQADDLEPRLVSAQEVPHDGAPYSRSLDRRPRTARRLVSSSRTTSESTPMPPRRGTGDRSRVRRRFRAERTRARRRATGWTIPSPTLSPKPLSASLSTPSPPSTQTSSPRPHARVGRVPQRRAQRGHRPDLRSA